MRRFLALLSAFALVCSLAAPSVAAAPAPREARTNGFVGSFDMVEPGSGRVTAHVVAQFKEPTFEQLVPGSLDIYWAPGVVTDPYWGTNKPFGARESHAQILRAAFWEAGSDHPMAAVQGWLCDYIAPCHPFQMAFGVSGDLPTRNVVGFGTFDWCCDGQWYDVGKGTFKLTAISDTPNFPWESSAAAALPASSVSPASSVDVAPALQSAKPATKEAAGNGFVGNFDLLDYGNPPRLVGRVVAEFKEPTFEQPMPGSLDIDWAPNLADTGLGWPPPGVRESHAQILRTWFSHGTDGFTHARVQGVLCDYIGPQNASCREFQMDFAANDDRTLPNEVGFGPYETCCTGPYYVAGKGAFKPTYAAPTESPSPHVGASYMTFWGLDPSWPGETPGAWSYPRSDSPMLGEYASADPRVAERHIATATSYGVNLFFMDFGWIQPGDPLDLAAQSGLLRAKNIDLMDIAVLYFPDAVVSDWGQGPDRLRSDFDYLAATYFIHPSYLRVDGRPVVILNGLTAYWDALGVDETNALFAEVKEKYNLYLVAGFHPDADPANFQDSPFDALTIWGNLWWSLGDEPDQTYTYTQYADAYRLIWKQWHDFAVSGGFQFVPSVYPGFDDVLWTSFGADRHVIERNLAEFTSLTQYARDMTTDPLNMTMFFSWNDFSEGHAIEPSDNYGDAYLKAIASTFAK